MKNFNISPGLLPGVIHIPPSKSYANRALILGALKKGRVDIDHLPMASDVTFLIDALKKIGLNIEIMGQKVLIHNDFPYCEKTEGEKIFIGEGGTTARFLACMLALGSAPYELILGKRLKDRPWDEWIKLIQNLGGRANLEDDRLFIQGPIKMPTDLDVDCSKTSQFASGLELTLGFLGARIRPQFLQSSQSYWEMTKKQVHHFKNYADYTVPLDWSSASYPLCFGALRQKIFFPGLTFDPHQADSKLFNIFNQLGIIEANEDGLKVRPGIFKKDFQLDVSDCLDLVPALVFFLSHVEGNHRLWGIENLIYKESDRISELIKLLHTFNLKAQATNHILTIEGRNNLQAPAMNLVLPDDHRIVMSAALFLRYHQGGIVSPANAVEKSYPGFFELMIES